MTNQSIDHSLSGFSNYLVLHGLLDKNKAEMTLRQSVCQRLPFISCLRQLGFISHLKLAESIATYFGLPLFDLSHYDLCNIPNDSLILSLVEKYFIMPLFKRDNQLILAVADPSVININELNFMTGLSCAFIIVEADKLTAAIEMYQKQRQSQPQIVTEFEQQALNILDPTDLAASEKDIAATPVVKFLNQILEEAVNKKASDIHFEPYEEFYRIRFRIDGILYETSKQSLQLTQYLTARLKIMANLDIAERRLPQDGRFKLNLSKEHTIDFRLNTCPMLYGEKAVLRLLPSSSEVLDLNLLGFSQTQQALFTDALCKSAGLILVTGPTGSGKTTTLYTALARLNSTKVNICTVEDPIEIRLCGVNQVQVNPKIGLSFATALRSFLRQDPDIIMVGEIRDLETAEIAIKASQTGHLVLATLHTNNAIETLTRLANIGIAPYNIADSTIMVIAQRLVRKLCIHCKVKTHFSASMLVSLGFYPQDLEGGQIYKASSCSQCHQGYRGRTGIFELLPISPPLSKLIAERGNTFQLTQTAKRENIVFLQRSGLEVVKSGITSIEELNRVMSK